jgi:adenylate cyclase
VSKDAPDTFIRYQADGEPIDLALERLCICGIGRTPQNRIVLADPMVSREHAIIRRNATGECIVNDLGSTNGTRINGRPVSAPTALVSGDELQIGGFRLEFVQNAPPLQTNERLSTRTQYLLEQQLVSVLVADLRNYTALTTAMGEKTVTEMMGEIFRDAGDLLRESQCWSSKFIGDGIMALWSHPSNSISRADIVKAFDVISGYQGIFRMAERKYHLASPLKFGCGYNAGLASIGNLGSAGSADFTAMGETVNIAFRLESATKEVGCDLLIAQAVFDALEDIYFRPDGMRDVALKGFPHAFSALPLVFDQVGGFVDDLINRR